MIPVVAIARVVLDAVEIVVDGAELLPDALDEGADVDAIPLLAPAGHETFAAYQIVDLAVGEVALGHIGQHLQDGEFRQGQLDPVAVPEGPADGGTKLELPAPDDLAAHGQGPFAAV